MDPNSLYFAYKRKNFLSETGSPYLQVFWIRDVLIRIRILICGSIPLDYGSGSFSFLAWLSRCQQKFEVIGYRYWRYVYISFHFSKLVRSHSWLFINFFIWWKDRTRNYGSGSVKLVIRKDCFWAVYFYVNQAGVGEVPECGNHFRHTLAPGHVSKGTLFPIYLFSRKSLLKFLRYTWK